MKRELVSIILPTFNRPDELKKAIQSVLSQTYQKFEIIIINDYPLGDIETCVNSFNDDRIRTIKNSVNVGHSRSRNIGVKAASGEYIAFIDDDIEWFPEKLEMQIEQLSKSCSKTGGIFTSYYKIWNKKKRLLPVKGGLVPGLDFFESLLFENFIDTPSLLIKKKCIEKCGDFDENLKCFVDWDLSIRIAKKFKLEFIQLPLYVSKDLLGSVTRQAPQIRAENLEYIFNKYHTDISVNKIITSVHCGRIGENYVLAGDVKKGQKFLMLSIKQGGTIKAFLYFYASFLGDRLIQLAIRIKRFFL